MKVQHLVFVESHHPCVSCWTKHPIRAQSWRRLSTIREVCGNQKGVPHSKENKWAWIWEAFWQKTSTMKALLQSKGLIRMNWVVSWVRLVFVRMTVILKSRMMSFITSWTIWKGNKIISQAISGGIHYSSLLIWRESQSKILKQLRWPSSRKIIQWTYENMGFIERVWV